MLGRKPSQNATSRGRGQEHEEAEAELSYGNSRPKAKSLFVQATTGCHTLRDFSSQGLGRTRGPRKFLLDLYSYLRDTVSLPKMLARTQITTMSTRPATPDLLLAGGVMMVRVALRAAAAKRRPKVTLGEGSGR